MKVLSVNIKPVLYLVLVLLPFIGYGSGILEIYALKCEYSPNPIGIETKTPRLSWKLKSRENGQKQTAYQILVASSESRLKEGEADLWNSGRVDSEQSIFIKYEGALLLSTKKYWWTVRVWNASDKDSPYSEPATFEMAMLNPEQEFTADWLSHPDQTGSKPEAKPAPYFRKEFKVDKNIMHARAYVTGLGYFVFSLNGKKVGDHVLDPVMTRYDKRVKYVTFDITEQLKRGKNAAGVVLGTGWYNHFAESAWDFNEAPWRSYPTFKLLVEITYSDGSTAKIASDKSWKASYGPIRFDGIRNGEVYDARMELKNWNNVGFNDKNWLNVAVVDGPKGKLSSQQLPAIKEMKEIKPKSYKEVKPGVYVFDLGQNIAGYCRIKIKGNSGDSITLKHGERLFADGTVEQTEIYRFLRTGVAQTDKYILKGEGVESWKPNFVYHGFQYIEVKGLKSPPSEDFLTGIVIHTSFEDSGTFESSNALYNQIQENTLWSFIGNYHGLPTDCPHREKVGWAGDAQLTAESGLLNYDVGSAYVKWMDDFKDEQQPSGQLPGIIPTSGWGYIWTRWANGKPVFDDVRGYGPAWESAYVHMPWDVYLYTGNKQILEEHYEGFVKYLEYLLHHADGLILRFGMGDHAAPRKESDAALTSTAYFFSSANILSKVARLLGKDTEAMRYEKLATNIKKAFHDEFYIEASGYYADSMQTSMAAPLYFGLVPDSLKTKVTENLITSIHKWDNHLNTGILGTKFILNTLAEQGEIEVAYTMTNKTTFPSYGHWIERGANTLWQKWTDGSRNHIMFGDISAWFYKSIAGINPDPSHPGFKHILFKPNFPDDLQWAKASHDSMYGTIRSSWEKKENMVTLEVEIPVNCTASLQLPEDYYFKASDSEGKVKKNNLNLESGRHTIVCLKE